jgi:trehalose 6-phosphate phosphatase
VEAKGVTVAIHDRGVAPSRLRDLRRSVRGVARAAARLGYRPIAGRRVTEFAPRGIDKGRALAGIRRRAAADAVFYFGDSAADEPAFKLLGAGGYSIRVGPGPTRARFRVRDLRGVPQFLRALLSIRER